MKHGQDRRERERQQKLGGMFTSYEQEQTAATSLVMRELSISPQKTDSPQARG